MDSPPSFTSSPLDSPLRCRELPTSCSHPLDLSAGKSPHRSARTRRKAWLPILPLGWEVTFLPHLLLEEFFLFLCF